jgi:nucleotide-binding universal stress UspA family protein
MLTASRLLHRRGMEVDVLCVAAQLAEAAVGARTGTHKKYSEGLAAHSRKILKDSQSVLAEAHLKTHGILLFGSPAERILELAANYDLAVVGAYGGHERQQPGLGPVSSRVLQSANANVFVGRELVNEDNFRVLVALDNSEASLTALRRMGDLLDVKSLDVTLMHVVEMPWANLALNKDMGGIDEDLSEYQRQLERELRQAGESAVDRGRLLVEQWGAPVTTIIEEGDPALELCSHAEEGGYDLIVTGATGTGDVKHALLGSVSLKLAWNAPCSVLVIRR